MSLANMNKILLLGNIGHDPEIRYTPKGNAVLTLSLATNRQFKTKEGDVKKETHWHKATIWGQTAENCARYLVKGSRILIEGELHSKAWTDKDGKTHKSSEIQADKVTFIGGTRQDTTGLPVEVMEAPAMTH